MIDNNAEASLSFTYCTCSVADKAFSSVPASRRSEPPYLMKATAGGTTTMNVLHLRYQNPRNRMPSSALVSDILISNEDLKTAGLCHRALGAASLVAALPKRQQEVLRGVAAGLLNKQIAYLLGISEKTVKMHRAQLLLNLGTPTTAGAVRLAVESSFAPLSQDYLAMLTDG